jgi:hypothetical protein
VVVIGMDNLKSRLLARAIISSGTLITLVTVVGAGRKWT